MATQGPLYPGTIATAAEAGDDNDWIDPTNVGADDGALAQVIAASFDTGDQSWALRCSNFGFTIPAGSTIDGALLEFERRLDAGAATDHQVQLFSAPGTLIGANKSAGAAWTGSMTVASYGGAADTWTAVLTPEIVNDPGFGAQIKGIATADNTDLQIDFVRMTITYTEGGSASAAVTGTATAAITETDVVAGSETVIVTLTGDTWVASGATFDAQRQAIIDGLDSAQAEATGWNAEVRDNLAVTTVVRTSDTVVTITLSAQAAYDITAQETITVTVPGAALTGGNPLTATPTFTVDFDDVTAPVLSAQTVDNITGEGGTPQVTTDEGNGTIYQVTVPNGDIPSDAQIKAGQQSSGAAALAASNQAVIATGVQTFAEVTGQDPVTAYDVWFLHRDAAGNDSTAVKADFTTNTAAVTRTWINQFMARQLVEQEWTGQQHGLEPGLGTPVARSGRRRNAGLLIMEE